MTAITMTRMQKVRAKMLLAHPFFATLLLSMPMKETTDVPTMGTDMKTIYINPDFVESMEKDEHVLFVLAHEVMHVALEHGLRLQGRNPMIFNAACDYAINLILVNSGLEMPTGEAKGLLDEQYKGMSADQIYELLYKELKSKSGGGQGQQKGQGSGDRGMGRHENAMLGDLMDPDVQSPAEQAKMQRQIQQRVAQAAQVARMAGKLSGDLERLVGELLDPKVPWSVLLRDYMTRAVKDDESWGRRNRRFQNVYLPTRYSERMGEIVIIGDTSGSIGNEELRQYVSEMSAIAEDVRPERIRLLWADTKVKGEQVFECGEPIIPKPVGGGGTDMGHAIQEALVHEPEVIVLCTDGYSPWCAEPDVPLIICCTTDVEVPIGQVVRL